MKYKIYVEETDPEDETIEWVYHGTWDNIEEAMKYINMIEENEMRAEIEAINDEVN